MIQTKRLGISRDSLNIKAPKKLKILLFAPFSSIWKHTVLEHQLVRLLQLRGHEVSIITCGEIFTGICTARAAKGLSDISFEKDLLAVCRACRDSANLVKNVSSSKSYLLSDFLQPKDYLTDSSFYAGMPEQEILTLNFKGISVGRLALFELILRHKKRSTTLTSVQAQDLQNALKNIQLTAIASERILDLVKPDIAITLNPQYGIPGAFAELSISKRIKTYYLSGSSLLNEIHSTVQLWDWEKYKWSPAKNFWEEAMNFDINTESSNRIDNHFKTIKKSASPWVYSPKSKGQSSRKFFQIPADTRIVLATVNSQDEIYAAYLRGLIPKERYQSTVFESQMDWIQWLISESKAWENACLIVRIHPRGFPNRRENVVAEQTEIWTNLAKVSHPNLRFDLPSMGFSISDHYNEIDVLTTGWSSTSFEALYHGIPVVTYDRNQPDFPAEIHLTGSSIADYSLNLTLALSSPNSHKRKSLVRKYLAFKYILGGIYLGGDLTARAQNSSGLFSWLIPRVLHRFPRNWVKKLDLIVPPSRKDWKKLINLIEGKNNSLYEIFT